MKAGIPPEDFWGKSIPGERTEPLCIKEPARTWQELIGMGWRVFVEATSALIGTSFVLGSNATGPTGRRCAFHQLCHCQMDLSQKTIQQSSHLRDCACWCWDQLETIWPFVAACSQGCEIPGNEGRWARAHGGPFDNGKLPATGALTRNRKKCLMRMRWICSPEWAEDCDTCCTKKTLGTPPTPLVQKWRCKIDGLLDEKRLLQVLFCFRVNIG